MERTDLTQFDRKPEAMVNYLRYNGPHFSEALCKFAVSKMWKRSDDNNVSKLVPWSKQEVDNMVKNAGIEIRNDALHDSVYVANMCKADYYGSSINDELHVALYVKDVLDDEDGYDGIAFNRFLADCARKGVAIPWERVL